MLRTLMYKIILCLLLMGCVHSSMATQITLKDKIGQMILIGFKGTSLTEQDPIVKSILAQNIGGVVLFDYDYSTKTYHRNIESPQQVKALTQQLQAYAAKAAALKKNHLVPLIISIDYEGGQVNRLKSRYGFPSTQSAADIARGTKKDAQIQAEQMASTLAAVGINLNFAPVLDVNVNPNNPVIGKLGRSFSNKPEIVIENAEIVAKAHHDHGVLCAYKHFPGHGSSTEDTHTNFVDITQTWKEYELDPYKALFSKEYSCPIVMMAHVVNTNLDSNGYPASLSARITTEKLRHELNFKGVVITDDMQMKAITDQYGLVKAVELAVNAGADILIFGNQLVPIPQDPQQIVDILYDAVQSGRIPEARIEEAYQRIMKLKNILPISTTK